MYNRKFMYQRIHLSQLTQHHTIRQRVSAKISGRMERRHLQRPHVNVDRLLSVWLLLVFFVFFSTPIAKHNSLAVFCLYVCNYLIIINKNNRLDEIPYFSSGVRVFSTRFALLGLVRFFLFTKKKCLSPNTIVCLHFFLHFFFVFSIFFLHFSCCVILFVVCC